MQSLSNAHGVDEAKSGGPIQLRVRVYHSGECDMSGTMACSCASRGARIGTEHTISKGDNKSVIALIKNLILHG
jgi:hypothetical protein